MKNIRAAADNFIVVFVTAKDQEEAQKISRGLVGQELIACANILSGIKSFFWWEGKIDQADEVLLVMKTQQKFFPRVVKAVKALHSYSVPEIIALPIVDGNEDYLKWVSSVTR